MRVLGRRIGSEGEALDYCRWMLCRVVADDHFLDVTPHLEIWRKGEGRVAVLPWPPLH
jgi:hypothetical protein